MAGINLGNVVGLSRGPIEPTKKYLIWAKTIAPGVEILLIWNYQTLAWDPINNANPYYQNPVIQYGLNDPPATPNGGDRYVIGTVPTGTWIGHGRYIAEWNGADWNYTPPLTTMQVASEAEPGKLYIFNAIDWVQFASGPGAELIAFNGNRPVTRAIPGLQGVTVGGNNVVEFLNKAFFIAVAPGINLTIRGGNVKEFGESTAVILDWVVSKGTNNITAITVNGVPISPVNGGNQSGSVAATGDAGVDTNFTASVSAGTVQTGVQNASDTEILQVRHKRFFFTNAQDLYNMDDAAITAVLNGLTNIGVTKWEYATGKDSPARVFNPDDEYFYYVYLNSYNLASFTINNSPNTDFQTKSFAYVNSKGYSAQFRLYRTTYLLKGAFTIDAN